MFTDCNCFVVYLQYRGLFGQLLFAIVHLFAFQFTPRAVSQFIAIVSIWCITVLLAV